MENWISSVYSFVVIINFDIKIHAILTKTVKFNIKLKDQKNSFAKVFGLIKLNTTPPILTFLPKLI